MTAAAAAGLAVACVALTAAPAFADQVRNQEWWLSALHVTTAWESSKGSGVTVAVLDTGVDSAQADLTGSVTTGPDYTASGRKSGGSFWGTHGTAIASLIAGHGHGASSGDGIMGVAPAAKILSVRVTLEGSDPLLTDSAIASGLPASIAKGIRYAVSNGAQVIDLPLDPAALAGTSPGGSSAEQSAVAYALSKKVVLVAPGGDGGAGMDTINYPAAYPGVISVGAFSQSFTKANFTSRRSYVTLTAAGDGVEAATPSGYAMMHSTSAASAVVAGMAALIKAQFPTLTPAQVTSALTQSTVFRPPGGRLNGSGFGTADAQAALVAAARINAAVPTQSGSGGAGTPPTHPAVRPQSPSIWNSVRYVAAGVAVLLVIGVIAFLLYNRSRKRRARAQRLAPLRDVARAAARAQGGFSTPAPSPGGPFAGAAQFAGSAGQFAAAPYPGPQYAETPFPGDERTQPRLSGEHAQDPFPEDLESAPFPGDDSATAQFSVSQLANGPFPPAQRPATQAPPAHVPHGPFPPAEKPESPMPVGLTLGGQMAGGQMPRGQMPHGQMSGASRGQIPRGQIPPGEIPGGEIPGGQMPGGQMPGAAGGQMAGGQMAGGQMAGDPGSQMPGAQMPGAQMPGISPFPAAPPVNGATGAAPRAPLPPTPRPRPSVVRPPRISGTPPWKPAEKPEGELPWAAVPPTASPHSRSAGPRRVVPTGVQPWGPASPTDTAPGGLQAQGAERQSGTSHGGTAPDDSERGDSAQDSRTPSGRSRGGRTLSGMDLGSASPGEPVSDNTLDRIELGGRVPGSMPLPAPHRHAADDDDDDEGNKPIYVWNPAEVTESFPRVPPGESGRSS